MNALETLNEATALKLAAQKASRGPHASQGEQHAAEVAELEASDREWHASRAAAEALEAAEVADGDELTTVCGLESLCDDLDTLEAEKERLQREVQKVIAAIPARVQLAKDTYPRLVARRSAAGLPAPLPLPQVSDAKSLRSNLERRRTTALVSPFIERIAAAKSRLAAYQGSRAQSEAKEAQAKTERDRVASLAEARTAAKSDDLDARLAAHNGGRGSAA